MVDPKIGFAIICKCRERQQGLEVLSIRRGQSSQAPGKWSFPGGKLALGDDSEEKRILSVVEAQCGGGEPAGLPPLIHIIRLYNETAKAKQQTIYHVFVLDTNSSEDNSWWTWHPRVANCNDVDTLEVNVTIEEDVKPSCGHFWMDLDMLIEFCSNSHPNPGSVIIDSRGGTLHPGLIKWIQNHGTSVMKLLITRSPKQVRTRVDSSSSSTSSNMSPQTMQTSKPLDGVVKHASPSPGVYSHLYNSPLLAPPPPPFSHYPSVPVGMSLGVPSHMFPVPFVYAPPPPPVKRDKESLHNSVPVSVTANTVHNPVPVLQPHSPKQIHHRSHIICQYFLKGSCKFGHSCRYLHPDLSGNKHPVPPFTVQPTPTHLYQSVPCGPVLPSDPPRPFVHTPPQGPTLVRQSHAPRQMPPMPPVAARKNIPFQLVGQIDTKSYAGSLDSANTRNCLVTSEGKNIFFVCEHHVHLYKLILSENTSVIYPEQTMSHFGTFATSTQNQDFITAIFCTKLDDIACIGTSGGSIVKYNFSTKQTVVILNGKNGPHITALLHYMSSDHCQVVVGGNSKGMLFWHIAKPHQKDFINLLSEQKHNAKITGLEIMGNQMISSSEDGQVYFWSIGGSMPVGLGAFSVCEISCEQLVSLLVVDTDHFMALSRSVSDHSCLKPRVWKYANPPCVHHCFLNELTDSVCCAGVVQVGRSQSLIALGLANGVVNIYSSPQFALCAQLMFEDMNEFNCVKMAATLETSLNNHTKHPTLSDVLIVTLWSCGIIKVCKVEL